MNFGTRLKTLAQLAVGYDKAALKTIKSMSNFTNEPAYFNAPIYGLTPPDIFLGSNDYRGSIDSAITGANSSRNFLELFDCVPEIFAPIHAIASRIANADFQLRKYRNDQVVFDNEDWNRIYNRPNPLQHFRDLIYEAIVYELVTGNEYMYFNTPSTLGKDYKNVAAVWNLPAEQIEPIANSSLNLFKSTEISDVITRYKLDKDNFFEPKDILHIRSINLNWKARKLKGRTPLLSADKAVANLIAVYEARNVIYTKKGALGAIVSRKSDDNGLIPLAKGEKDKIRAEFHSTYGITGNKSPYAITDQPVDFIKFGGNIQELEPFKETLADAKAIYSVLSVPEDLMPNDSGATFENQIQAERRLYNGVVIPMAQRYMDNITSQLGLDAAKLYLHASFDHVDALQENKKEKATVMALNTKSRIEQFMIGVITLNDFVVQEGYDKQSNPLYDKRIFDMDEIEFAKVKEVLSIKASSINNNQNNQDGNATNNDQQQQAS